MYGRNLHRARDSMALALTLALSALVWGCAEPAGGLETAALALDGDGPVTAAELDKGSFLTSPVEGDPIGPCGTTRWIGRVGPDAKCPEAEGKWKLAVLFQGSAAVPSAPGAVGGYCVYTWAGEQGAPTKEDVLLGLPTLDTVDPMKWLDPDCHVVTPLAACDPAMPDSAATAIADYLGERRVEHYIAQDEPALPYPIRTDSGAGLVYLAMVDTSVDLDGDAGPGTGASHHGRVLGGIAQTLTCRAWGHCAATIRNHLALDVVKPGVQDQVCGGHFGYHSVLAQAIDDAVSGFETWKAAQYQPERARLVINLSIGWDPRYSCDDSGGAGCELTEGARLVRAALRRASCAGALVLAAAGSAAAGGDPGSGPMLPGLWMNEPAPSEAMCKQGQLDLDWDPTDPKSVELWGKIDQTSWKVAPLVWAIGGVDAADEALANGRPGARTLFAAPAFEGLFMDRVKRATQKAPADWTNSPHGRPRPSPALTGTSVAAVVAAAAAAGVWHWRPALSPASVMWTLYRFAEPLGVTADACFGPTCDLRRVSVCRSVGAACAPFGCSTECATRPAYDGAPMTWDPAELADVDAMSDGAFLYGPPPASCGGPPLASCSAGYDFYGDDCAVDDYCPEETVPNGVVAPWVEPQPGWTPCGACALLIDAGVSDVLISIDPRFGGTLLNGRLVTTTTTGTETFHFAPSVPALAPGDAITVRVVGIDPVALRGAAVVFDEASSGHTYADLIPVSEVVP